MAVARTTREKQPFRLNTDDKTLFGFSGVVMKGCERALSGPEWSCEGRETAVPAKYRR